LAAVVADIWGGKGRCWMTPCFGDFLRRPPTLSPLFRPRPPITRARRRYLLLQPPPSIKVPGPLSSIRLSFTDLERSSLLRRPHCPACISHIHPYMDQLVSCLLRSALAVN
jgi:hypothetical protein